MKKYEFLTANLPHELKVKILCGDGVFDTVTPLTVGNLYELGESRMKPIIRPLSDLTKPITQANYNNGEPFVPALELIKLEERYSKWKDPAPTIPYDIEIIQKPFGKVLKVSKLNQWVVYLSLSEMERAKYYVIQLLLMWHFDLITEDCEKVFTTSEFNPYK